MVALGLDEQEFSGATDAGLAPRETMEFPVWNRTRLARFIRRLVYPTVLLPLTKLFAHVRTEGRENLNGLKPPVIFASNHQSYMDVTVLLAALRPPWRYLVAPAMRKEFFDEHFHGRSFTNSLNYYLSTWLLNTFPIPQREAGAYETLRYMAELAGEKWCVLIFPEGRMTDTGEIATFQPGVGMMASKLGLPVVPLRIEGLEKVLHKTWKMARPGRVRVAIGKPLQLSGGDYTELAKQVEEAVKHL
jgi:long-chain acyl-CoA synthetase